MSSSFDTGSGAERTESVDDSLGASPVRASSPVIAGSSRASSPSIPRLTSTLLVPTTIPTASSLASDVLRPTDVVRPMRPARGTRPLIPSSVNNRAGLLSTIRDRSRAPVAAADPVRHATMVDALHDPNNEAPAARRSSLAISGARPSLGIGKRGLPSSLSQRAHMFASIRDRSRSPVLDASSASVDVARELSENRTPEE